MINFIKKTSLFLKFLGENVNEFFFRAVALTFDRAVLRELEGSDVPAKKNWKQPHK